MPRRPEEAQARIVEAALAIIAQRGLAACSLDDLSRSAGCAKGLINYHFGTKRRLLEGVGTRLQVFRHQSRRKALRSGTGTAALDSLWEVLLREVRDGQAAAWCGLVAEGLARTTLESAALAEELARDAEEALGLETGGVPGLLLAGVTQGLQAELLSGALEDRAREAFDQFWVAVLTG